MTAEEDYPRQLKAIRICGTVLLLISGTQALAMSLKIKTYMAIFENMVEGGVDSMPRLTKFLMQNQTALLGLILMAIIGSLWGLWLSRRLSTMIYLAGGMFAFFVLINTVIELGMQQPLTTIITKFQH